MRIRSLALVLLLGLARPAVAQTPADTAAVILNVARALEREGKRDAARDLLRHLRTHYATSAAARTADSLLRSLPGMAATGAGRTAFITFNTLYGGFLGVAIPAAFDDADATAAGIGLLVGAPAGFFLSRAFARKHFTSSGQAGIASFATIWGTWLGLALQDALDIGEEETCGEFGCYSSGNDRAPFAAMSLGGLAGIGVGWALASTKEIRPGTSTLISSSAFWGSWFGVALGYSAGLHDDDLFISTLVAGNGALLAAIPAAKAWRPSSSRVRLITAAGLAGGLAGLGVVLIAQPDNDQVAIVIPAATSAAGLLVGTFATRHQGDLDSPEPPAGEANALLQWRNGLRLSLAIPEPVRFPVARRSGGIRMAPGMRLPIFSARF